jgi:hypothetical protein
MDHYAPIYETPIHLMLNEDEVSMMIELYEDRIKIERLKLKKYEDKSYDNGLLKHIQLDKIQTVINRLEIMYRDFRIQAIG